MKKDVEIANAILKVIAAQLATPVKVLLDDPQVKGWNIPAEELGGLIASYALKEVAGIAPFLPDMRKEPKRRQVIVAKAAVYEFLLLEQDPLRKQVFQYAAHYLEQGLSE